MDIVTRLHRHALPDPHDERDVLHAPLLKEAANGIERLRKQSFGDEMKTIEAMKLAMEALLEINEPLLSYKAITTLKTEIKRLERAEPFATLHKGYEYDGWDVHYYNKDIPDGIYDLYLHPVPDQWRVEPVAWLNEKYKQVYMHDDSVYECAAYKEGELKPLYTALASLEITNHTKNN